MVVSQEDLDNFLTTVESKLRGPFSSLDIARAVTSTRDLSPRQYLQQLHKVFPRMDKVTKLRVLVALLGLDPSDELDDLVYAICSEAQEGRLVEEWVKVIAGLNQGILFQDTDGSRESCRGEEAQRLLEKSCDEILERVQEAGEHADNDPLFSPYMYSLLNSNVLGQVLPECLDNTHFTANLDADILKEDERMEQKKLQDGDSGNVSKGSASSSNGTVSTDMPKARDLPTMPGIKSISRKPKAAAGKSSLFMPKKKPVAAVTRPGAGPLGNKLSALRRKPGTAQALLSKGRPSGARGTSSIASSQGKYGGNKSRMKMVDLAEVQGLQEEAKQRTAVETSQEARKRKLMEAAAAKGLVSKKAKTVGTVSAAKAAPGPPQSGQASEGGGGVVAAALSAYQSKQPTNGAANTEKPPSDQVMQGEWTQHLDKSNRLTDEDRERVRQFFVDRTNPTPDKLVCRLKLHEEKTLEPETGLTVKETLYLELDYSTFTFKKLRKLKKKAEQVN